MHFSSSDVTGKFSLCVLQNIYLINTYLSLSLPPICQFSFSFSAQDTTKTYVYFTNTPPIFSNNKEKEVVVFILYNAVTMNTQSKES